MEKMATPWFAALQLGSATLLFLVVTGILLKEGVTGLFVRLIATLRLIPGVDAAISAVLRRQVSNFVRQIDSDPAVEKKSKVNDCKIICIPEKGVCAPLNEIITRIPSDGWGLCCIR